MNVLCIESLHQPDSCTRGGQNHTWLQAGRRWLNCDFWQAGFGVAVQYALDLGMDAIWQRIQLLASLLRELLSQVPGVHIFDSGGTLCGIIAFSKVRKVSLALNLLSLSQECESQD